MVIEPSNRKLFAELGLDFVKTDIGIGAVINTEEKQQQALEWMVEENTRVERRDKVRFWLMLLFTFIAAIAACIAAYPVLFH